MNFPTMIKRPTAFLPVAMSFGALTVVLAHITMFGVGREADEGTAAHLFQLLMVAQVPIIALFAIKWLPQTPKHAVSVLAVQAGAAFVAIAPVYFLNL